MYSVLLYMMLVRESNNYYLRYLLVSLYNTKYWWVPYLLIMYSGVLYISLVGKSSWGVLCRICDDYEHQNQYSNDNHLRSRFLWVVPECSLSFVCGTFLLLIYCFRGQLCGRRELGCCWPCCRQRARHRQRLSSTLWWCRSAWTTSGRD